METSVLDTKLTLQMRKKSKALPSEKSANDWLADILKASGPTGKVDQVPEGWLTIAQMSQMTETAMSTINFKMMRGMRSGQIQRKRFRIRTDRQVAEVWHYCKA